MLSLDVLSGRPRDLGGHARLPQARVRGTGRGFRRRDELFTDEAIDVIREIWTNGEIETTGRRFQTARHDHAPAPRAEAAPANLGRRPRGAAGAKRRRAGLGSFFSESGRREPERATPRSRISRSWRGGRHPARARRPRPVAPNQSTSASPPSPAARRRCSTSLGALEQLRRDLDGAAHPRGHHTRRVDRRRSKSSAVPWSLPTDRRPPGAARNGSSATAASPDPTETRSARFHNVSNFAAVRSPRRAWRKASITASVASAERVTRTRGSARSRPR